MFNQEDAQYQQFAQIYKNNLEEVLIGGKFVLQQNMGNFPVILYYLTNLIALDQCYLHYCQLLDQVLSCFH